MKFLFSILLLNILLFPINGKAQSKREYSSLLSEKRNDYTGQNLKDSVKVVYSKMDVAKQNLIEAEKSDFLRNNDIHGYKYIHFDRLGRIKERLGSSLSENYVINFDKKKLKSYEYDESDWIEKNKYKISLKQYIPIQNHNLLQKLNKINVPKDTVIIGDKIWQEYDVDVYNYIYDKQGRIQEEQSFCVYRVAPIIDEKKPNDGDLSTRKLFIYDRDGLVINQKIIRGSFSKNMPYTDMGTESPFCDDLQLQYKYDKQARIIQVTMYGCEKIVAKDEYIYHPTKDYVEKVKCLVTGPGEISNPTKNFIQIYNEQGDLIQKEFVPDNPEQNLVVKVRYYTYEYDSHNNWIKCNMFLEGTPDGEPTLVAERKIEYYN